MILFFKLLISLATTCFAVGYAARRRDNSLHRRAMMMGVLAAWGCAALFLIGRYLPGDFPRTAFWLIDLLGSHIAVTVLEVLALAMLPALTVQALLGVRRHPAHRPLSRAVIPLWLVLYICAMFFYV